MAYHQETSLDADPARQNNENQRSSNANRGIVYILSNDAMEGYIKVGQTSGSSAEDVLTRMRDLSRATGVPRSFNCEYAAVVDNYIEVEQTIFRAFAHNRVAGKEFLEGVPPVQVQVLLQLKSLNPVDITPRESSHDPDVPPGGRRPGFKFYMAGVEVGETIQWATDPDKVAVVVGLSEVEYEGEPVAISRITAELLGLRQRYVGYSDRHWTYKGETLEDRRKRFEEQPSTAGS